jgi:hypothetical protein
MAQPFEAPGPTKSALRPFGRESIDLRAPSTSVVRLTRFQSSASPAFPCSSGICQCERTGTRSASGKRARISRPRGCASAAGSR